MSKPTLSARPEVAPQPDPWDLRTDPYVLAEFPAELVLITVGVTFIADVRGLVPDVGAARFWDAFWADFADTIETTLRANLRTGSPAGLETARQTARRMLADRFAEVAHAAALTTPHQPRR